MIAASRGYHRVKCDYSCCVITTITKMIGNENADTDNISFKLIFAKSKLDKPKTKSTT